MRTKSTLMLVIGIALAAFAITISACGGDDEPSSEEVDGAFVAEMVPHHESAIAMAEVAQDEADHPEVKQLADDIVAAQSTEIETLNAINERLFGEPVSKSGSGDLGLDDSMMGMDMDPAMLEGAKPFDREFIDMMIPHHQGAIRMARVQLTDGSDAETKELAEEIIAAQSQEIDQMNEWREEWYGASSPAGGVPADGEMMDMSMEGMDH